MAGKQFPLVIQNNFTYYFVLHDNFQLLLNSHDRSNFSFHFRFRLKYIIVSLLEMQTQCRY